MDKRIAIVGSGAQGAGIGADFVRAGLDVSFIEQWPAHVEAIRDRGIEVRLPESTEVTRVPAFHLCDVATMRTRFDMVFLLVKAYDTRWSCELIKPILASDGVVVGLQNGMSIDDIASVVGRERTIGAVIEMASNMYEPGIVNRQTPPDKSWFAVGSLDPENRLKVEAVHDVLSFSGTVEVSNDIRSAKWMKLVANAGELVPSAILDLSLEDAMNVPGVHQFMIECSREAARAAIVDGATLVPIFGMSSDEVTTPEQYAEDLLGRVRSHFSLPDTKTTVLQDWIKGRHSEVDEVNGLVVKISSQHKLQAPRNAHTTRIAHEIEAGERARSVENVELLLNFDHD
jgi:2-dehydropantoate 2-reductase